MENWDDFRFYSALKNFCTLRSAAEHLGTDQATVGRRIRSLEESLGVKLFEKRSDGYYPTSAGNQIGLDVDLIEKTFETVIRKIAGDDQRMEGSIRIASPGALANHLLIPRLQPFLVRHSGLTLQFLTGPEVVNLAKREADIAIRLVRPIQRGLYVKKIGDLSLALYGNKALIKSVKPPMTASDLKTFSFIGLHADAMSALEEELLVPLKPFLKYSILTHAWSSVFSAVCSGIGLGVLPTFMGDSIPTIEQLSLVPSVSTPLWLVLHPDLKNNARIRVLISEIEKILR